MKKYILILFLFISSQNLFAQNEIPEWFLQDCESNIGKWLGNNTKYKSEKEPFDAYALEWKWGIGNKSLIGKLYGLKNNLPSGDFWEFRQFWDPDNKAVVVEQFGADGTYGTGELIFNNSAQTTLVQQFTNPSGLKYRSKHLNLAISENARSSTSFREKEGEWIEDRTYIWEKVLPPDSSKCNCCTESHDDFDFWVGNWEVSDTTGKIVGHSRIEKIVGSCVIFENWSSAGTYLGKSFNYFDPNDKTWNQLWLDNSGLILKLKGGLTNDSMVLKSELLPGKKVDFYYNEINWTKNKDGSVTQIWDIKSKDEVLLQRAFKGIYRKK